MCGIVGLLNFSGSAISVSQFNDLFVELLYVDALRGAHGTGVFAVEKEGGAYMAKVGGPPHQLIATKDFEKLEKFVQQKYVRFIVGHNRYATRGEKTTKNAHPFRDEHIILVHNGTLDNYGHLPDKAKYEVDSALLAHAIAKQGIKEVIPNLEGAWTLVYWDANDETLNILRNVERPLYIATPNKDSKSEMVLFASEKNMLEWILDRNYEWGFDIEEVPADTLLTFSLNSRIPTKTPLKGKEVPKKSWLYGESFMARDAVATGEVAVTEVDKSKKPTSGTSLVVVGTSSNGTGEWTRGRTGQVKTPRILQPKGTVHDWVPVEALHDVAKGDFLVCEVQDYDKLGATPNEELFQIKATNDKYPDVEFRVNVKGQKLLDELIVARFGVRGKVHTILKSQYPPAQKAHVMYLHEPEPQHLQEPEVPVHAIH